MEHIACTLHTHIYIDTCSRIGLYIIFIDVLPQQQKVKFTVPAARKWMNTDTKYQQCNSTCLPTYDCHSNTIFFGLPF